MATRTTTELCRKFGKKILGEIISILHNTVTSPDARTRQGVCLMLSDIMYVCPSPLMSSVLTVSQGEYDRHAARGS